MPNYRKKPINPFFQRLMIERGWQSLKQVHDATGIHLNTLAKYANGEESLTLKTIKQMAKALSITPGELINGMLEKSA